MPTARSDRLVAYIDGGSRGNPGPAGFGVHVEDADGTVVHEFCEAVGTATNNVAEYRGLLAALGWAVARGERHLHVRSDSELLVRQMKGQYRVKNPGLQPLYQEARALVERFDRVTFEHVPREMNRDADRLANEAMDRAAQAKPARDPGRQSPDSGRRTADAASRSRRNSLPFDD